MSGRFSYLIGVVLLLLLCREGRAERIKDLATVPEPSALLLLTAGLVALGVLKKYVERSPARPWRSRFTSRRQRSMR